jgi:hypothetical protein
VVRNRWNRAWLLLGGAAAFHVLVGGWSVVAAGVAWLLLPGDRPSLRSMVPALAGGFVLSLPALIPSLSLTWGVDAQTVGRAHEIYVFERLAHHLVPRSFPPPFVDRFLLLAALLLVLDWATPSDAGWRRLRAFVVGALAIAGVGWGIGMLEAVDRSLAARLLRFYWFRLSDVALPLAVALLAARYAVHALRTRPRRGRWALAVATLVAAAHVGELAYQRVQWTVPRADRLAGHADRAHRIAAYRAWRGACRWIAESGEIPRDARFLTPKMSQTFKWYARRSEVATWKDVPQDAQSLVTWWETMRDVYATPSPHGGYRWHRSLAASLAAKGPRRVYELAERYGADYALTVRWPRLPFRMVYRNSRYVVYRLPDEAPPPPPAMVAPQGAPFVQEEDRSAREPAVEPNPEAQPSDRGF